MEGDERQGKVAQAKLRTRMWSRALPALCELVLVLSQSYKSRRPK
jgi:hypothetical protein